MFSISRIANLVVGALMVVGAIGKIIANVTFQTIIEGIYIILFGLVTVGLEFQIPPQVARYASFMFSFIGRGVFYIFVGTIMLASFWNFVGYLLGAIVGLVGVGYVVLEFLPQIEPPSNMREADAGWGAEQV
ncbi:Late Golgi vesicles protein [Thelotrema lepadinum]|nr:Late Golgi vesicles protein [Thelotrema lepadinum]